MKRGRRYLSGLDWIIHALDHATRRVSGVGNASQLVLELERPLDPVVLEERLQAFANLFPMLSGSVTRAWTLEPFWKMARAPQVGFQVERPAAEEVDRCLQACVNRPQAPGVYVSFHLLLVEDGACRLAMTFDHRLLDARGAELFLQRFSAFCAEAEKTKQTVAEELELAVPSFLPGWREKFASGREMMRSIQRFAEAPAVCLAPEGGQPGHAQFKQWMLSTEESERFVKRAYQKAGFLLFMPYALSRAIRAFDRLCAVRGKQGRYVVPCTTDLRGSDLSLKTLFFNYSSMFFFLIDPEQLANESALLDSVKQQFFEQTKQGFPKHLQHVMGLMRILPIKVFDWMICTHMKHCFGSFSFASVGTSLLDQHIFCGSPIKNLYHMPLIPPQVGIGFFINQFNDQINIGISYREGLLCKDDLALIAEELLAPLHE